MADLSRPSKVSGTFYPSEKEALSDVLSTLIQEENNKIDTQAIIVPHAGYVYSGFVAANVYSKINVANTVIIIGPDHFGSGRGNYTIWHSGVWKTPLGDVSINAELASELISEVSDFKATDCIEENEHSIEVQLPFIQKCNPHARIVPILVRSDDVDVLKKTGEQIANIVARYQREDILLIASTDMSHYEPHDVATKKDFLAIGAIEKLDCEELYHYIVDKKISMCGRGPCAIAMSFLRTLRYSKFKKIAYMTSGDVTHDYRSVVGYVGLVGER